ncbi:hypothetical protein LguiB_017926 [Lonicera macranthoides]
MAPTWLSWDNIDTRRPGEARRLSMEQWHRCASKRLDGARQLSIDQVALDEMVALQCCYKRPSRVHWL